MDHYFHKSENGNPYFHKLLSAKAKASAKYHFSLMCYVFILLSTYLIFKSFVSNTNCRYILTDICVVLRISLYLIQVCDTEALEMLLQEAKSQV